MIDCVCVSTTDPRAASYTEVLRINGNRCARESTWLNCGNAGFDLDEARDLSLRSVRFWNRLVSKSERYGGNRQARNWFISLLFRGQDSRLDFLSNACHAGHLPTTEGRND